MRTLIRRTAYCLFFVAFCLSLPNKTLAAELAHLKIEIEKPIVLLDGRFSSRYGSGPAIADAFGLWVWGRFFEGMPPTDADNPPHFVLGILSVTVDTKPAGLTILSDKKLEGPDRVNFSFLEFGAVGAFPYPDDDLAYHLSLFLGNSKSETFVKDGLVDSAEPLFAGGLGVSIEKALFEYDGDGWGVAILPSLFFRKFFAVSDGISFQYTGVNVSASVRW